MTNARTSARANYRAHVIIIANYEIRNFMKAFNWSSLFISILGYLGYNCSVDWWSLGIVAYEMRAGCRPFVIHSTTPIEEVRDILCTALSFPKHWNTNFKELIQKVRICNVYS